MRGSLGARRAEKARVTKMGALSGMSLNESADILFGTLSGPLELRVSGFLLARPATLSISQSHFLKSSVDRENVSFYSKIPSRLTS